jgi:hypothetical protein
MQCTVRTHRNIMQCTVLYVHTENGRVEGMKRKILMTKQILRKNTEPSIHVSSRRLTKLNTHTKEMEGQICR